MAAKILLVAIWPLLGQSASTDGTIAGVVLNASQEDAPLGGATVALRVRLSQEFVTMAETTADDQGRYVFRGLPVGEHFLYLPGANHQGIHYPGPRLRLSEDSPRVVVDLKVRDSLAAPNPLTVRSHEILVEPEPGALRVTETMLLVNPTKSCYVGEAAHEGGMPVTLALAVPSDFEKTTFYEEFFGRRFALVNGRLVTDAPWQPGERELKFFYVLRNEQTQRVWERPLDLPTSSLRLRVRTDKPEQVASNLGDPVSRAEGELVFESGEAALPAGHVIRLELDRLPVPWIAYGRWAAVGLLVALVGGGSFLVFRGRRRRTARAAARLSLSHPPDSKWTGGPHQGRAARRQRRRSTRV